MPPPRDRMAAMQAQAYFGEEDDYNIPIDDDDHGPMQDFFREIEEMRETANRVRQEIDKTKKLQNDILSAPSVDQKSKQELEDTMNRWVFGVFGKTWFIVQIFNYELNVNKQLTVYRIVNKLLIFAQK